ncbi:hypothetical protein [Massiliimalia timonensis]|uniref:hypothetical protein n=1 Tax=Massiliimalia timonensis TaxID=1987501 RepID=UPI00189E4116|nr:hypothetical protein [Massiliimalia timonensis]
MTEIEQAIYLLREGAENWRYTSQEWIDDKDAEAISLAIEALKEKAEREKGCEYCVNLTESATTLSFKAKGNGVKVVVDCDFDMKYCPKCGRKLVSEE